MQEAYRPPRSKCSLCYSVFGVGGGYPHPVLMVIPPSNLNGGGGLPHPVLTRGYPYPDLEPDLDRGTPQSGRMGCSPVGKDGSLFIRKDVGTPHQEKVGSIPSSAGREYPTAMMYMKTLPSVILWMRAKNVRCEWTIKIEPICYL